MSTQIKTYTVGNKGIVWRMTEHDPASWTDVSLSSMIVQTNILLPPNSEGFQTNITEGWLTYINLVDVMSDPADSDKVCTIAGRAQEDITTSVGSGYSGIFMSHDGGNSWFFPGGDWVNVCNTDTALCRNHFEIFYTDSATVYIISQFGYLFKSTDGGLSFNTVKKSGIPVNATGFEWVSCIHMRKDPNGGLDYGVVAAIEDVSQVASGTRVYKTINGGASWSPLNGNLPLENDYTLSQEVGEPGGIYISEDHDTIIVQAEDITTKSTDGGATFTCTLNNERRCFHLTWYDTYKDISDDFWVTGGITQAIHNSIDTASTWTQTLNPPNYTIYGAHFYTKTNGYFTNERALLNSTNSGSTPIQSLLIPSNTVDSSGKLIQESILYAVWSTSGNNLVELTDCTGLLSSVIVSSSDLQQQVSGGFLGSVTITGNVDIDEDACWTVSAYLGEPPLTIIIVSTSDVITIYDTCEGCAPTPPSTECWRLEKCPTSSGKTCQTVCTHTGFDFSFWQNTWVYLNGDTTCVYMPKRIRQIVFCSPDEVSILSALGSPWQVEYTVTSLIINGTQYITGSQPVYQLTDTNYDPLECAALTCSSVLPSTTENSYGNISDFLNLIFNATGLECPLEAFPNDPSNSTVSDTSFRMQYVEDESFLLILEKTGDTGSAIYQYSHDNGITEYSVDDVNDSSCFDNVINLCTNSTASPINKVSPTQCKKLECDLNATASYSNVTTNGGSNGSITITVSGNAGPVTYAWTPGGQTSSTLTGLSAGIYTVVVTDPTVGDDCNITLQLIIVEPPAPPVDETCEVIPRLGEPGFSVRNCDPKTVIKIKSQFSDSIYALFKRMRYGVETCCEFDLDKIDIKHQLLELGEMNDPDACKIICNSYTIASVNPEDVIDVEYRDCFGAKITVTLDSITPSLTFCSQINTIVSLGAAITITLIEECCDPVQIINMKYYCVSLVTTDITGVIQWYDYEGVLKRKTLTNVIGSCGPEGVDKMYMCAQEGTVAPIAPLLITDLDITEMGAC
jgi:hypothetical protein